LIADAMVEVGEIPSDHDVSVEFAVERVVAVYLVRGIRKAFAESMIVARPINIFTKRGGL
jgi:hypothetical protein